MAGLGGTMRTLIAVVTCERFRAKADALRATWVPEVAGADVRFFLGSGGDGAQRDDEVRLDDCPDDYAGLYRKVRRTLDWALRNGYDRIFKMDDDVTVFPERLLAAPPHNYSGRVRGPSGDYACSYAGKPLPSGRSLYGAAESGFCSGFGYWLSALSARTVLSAADNNDWAEDRAVGNILWRAGIKHFHDPAILLWPPVEGHYCHRPNGSCPKCVQQYAGASVLCPYARPELVGRLHRTFRQEGYVPTWLP